MRRHGKKLAAVGVVLVLAALLVAEATSSTTPTARRGQAPPPVSSPPSQAPSVPALPATGSAQRTFVSSTGNDANPCSRSAPCRNFQAALAQTAAGGEIVVLDSAGYGPVTIGQSVSIVAPSGVFAGVTAFSGNAVSINTAASDTVVLRGLTLNGLGGTNGIVSTGAGTLMVQDCVVKNFSGGSGIEVDPTGDQRLFVDDTTATDSTVGIRIAPSGGSVVAAIDHTRVEHNQFGIESNGSTHTTIRDSAAENQSVTGFSSFGGADVEIKDSVTAHNYYGVATNATMRVSDTLVNNNVVAISGPVISWGNNSVAGNTSSESFGSTIPLK